MSKTEVTGKQVKDGSIELVDLSTGLASTISGKADSSSLATVATSGAYADLTGKPSLFSGSYTDLTNKPSLFDGAYSSLTGAPSLATVATSGAYADLTGKPSLATVATSGAYADLTGKPSLATVATSGSYADLSNKPTLASFTTLTSPASNEFLKYNGSAWVNSALPVADASTAGVVSTGTQTLAGAKTFSGTVHGARYTETVANAFNTTLAPSSGTLTVDTSVGNAVLGALNAAVTTWAFTNVPTENSKATTVTVVLAGNISYTYGDACSVNGSAVTGGVVWSGGVVPLCTSGTDIITFMIVRDSAGTIKVFGSGTTNFS